MKVERISLKHRDLLYPKLHQLDTVLSEYSFANLYLFRNIHQYEVMIDGEVFVKGITRDQQQFLMPIFKPEQKHLSKIKSLLGENEYLYPIPQEWQSPFQNTEFKIFFNEDDSDYLFRVDKLALFPGRHLSKKRNLVKQLVTEHQVESESLSNLNKPEAIAILRHWQQSQETENDFEECLEALHLLDELGLQGELYYVDDQPAGFVIGEWINQNCFVVHFDKADKSTKGLYQYLLQHFAQSLENHEAWINLEQDLGFPVLRQSKHSYKPDIIAQKLRIRK